LTGCPTITYEIGKNYVNSAIEAGDLWRLIKNFDKDGFLMSGSTPGEDEEVPSNK
jgi:hypothetical protein